MVRNHLTRIALGTLLLSAQVRISLAFVPWSDAAQNAPRARELTLELDTVRQIALALQHPNELRSLAFSPDSRTLATAGSGPVLLWDLSRGTRIRALATPVRTIDRLCYSPRGDLLLAGSWAGGAVRCWRVSDGEQLPQFITDVSGVTAIAVSPDGRIVGSRTRRGQVYVHELATGKSLFNWQDKGGMLGFVAFSPDGKLLASGTDGASAHVWQFQDGKELESNPFRIGSCGTFVHDSKRLLLGAPNGPVLTMHHLPDPRSNSHFLESVEGWDGLSLTTNAKLLLASSRVLVQEGPHFKRHGRELIIFEIATKRRICTITDQHAVTDTPSQIAPDGKLIALAGTDAVYVLSLATLLNRNLPKEKPGINELWASLADENAFVAYSAITAISPDSKETVSLLRDKLAQDKQAEGRHQALSDKRLLRLGRLVDLLERIGGRGAAALLDEMAAAYPVSVVSEDATRAAERLRMRTP